MCLAKSGSKLKGYPAKLVSTYAVLKILPPIVMANHHLHHLRHHHLLLLQGTSRPYAISFLQAVM